MTKPTGCFSNFAAVCDLWSH